MSGQSDALKAIANVRVVIADLPAELQAAVRRGTHEGLAAARANPSMPRLWEGDNS